MATWMGPAIGIIALVLQQTNKKGAFDFRAFTIYLTFFVVMGVKLSNTVDFSKVTGVDIVWIMCFWQILWDNAGKQVVQQVRQNSVDNSAPKSETPTKTPTSQE